MNMLFHILHKLLQMAKQTLKRSAKSRPPAPDKYRKLNNQPKKLKIKEGQRLSAA